jgi:photosystem II stability/assembly factor-like uncharacterized protein
MKRRITFSCAALLIAGFALQAQSPRPTGPPVRSPTQPVQGVAPKPVPRAMAAPMSAVDPALFTGMRYRLVGPARGGRVTTVTGVPSQPRSFYMGVASGGVFRTTDGGASWTPISDGKIPLGSIGDIAVAGSDPRIIYVGTGSDGVRSNVSTGRGVYKTTDGGETWQFAGLRDAGQIGAVRIHPDDPNTVWISATGDIFKANAERGVFKTTDGGKTWKKVLFVNDTVGAMDVELQPGNPAIVYAWMSRLERKPWTIISGGKDGGFYKSTNGGETFVKITTGLPSELIGKGNLAVTAAKPDRLYVLIEAKPGGGMYRSDDAGQTWTALPSPPAMIYRPFYYTTIGADPTNADVVYGGAEGFWKSTDAGRTWASMRTPHGDNHDIWINPKDGNTMIQANDGGANVSFDGGRTWSSQLNQPTSELYGVWVDNEFPYKLYAAQQDNSTIIMPSAPLDPNDRFAFDAGGPGCETGPIMPHPKDPNIVYGSCKGQFGVMDLRTRQEKQYWIGAQSLYGNSGKDLILRFQRVSPTATSPHDPDVLYYGSQHVHRTRDKGVTWEQISPDLTAFPECCQAPSGEPITRDVTGEEFYSTLYAITEAPTERGVIWTGANDGPFHVTRDNGKTWNNITPKDLPPGGRVQWIDASPHRRGSAYFTVYRYLLGDYAPYVYRTDDYGKSWTRLTDGKNGIPADTPTRVVREDPDREGLLYAGTEFGMYLSFDNGAHWQPFNLNLPQVPITDIKVHKKDLVVTTQGRGFWILDNVTPLHQITPQITTTAAHLYKPRDGYRTRVSANVLGPAIDYYLPASHSGPVTVEILDPSGAVVNAYNSEAAAAGGGRGRGGRGGGGGGAAAPETAPMTTSMPDPEAPGGGRGRGGAPSRVTKDGGHNRFVWDARTSAGLSAVPGAYQARVKAGEWTATQPFSLLIDPRVAAGGVTVADLKEQFDHNVRVRELGAQAAQLLARVRAAMAGDPSKAAAARAIYEKLVNMPEGVRYNSPGLTAHIQYLAGMTSSVDQKIGRDAIERYQGLKRELDALRAQAEKL